MPAPPVYHYTQYYNITYIIPTHTARQRRRYRIYYDLPVSVRGANRVLVRDCCEQDVKNDIVDLLPIMDELLYRCHYYRRYSCRLRTHNSYAMCSGVLRGGPGRYIYCGGHFRAHKSFLMGDQSAHYIFIYTFTCTRLTWKKKLSDIPSYVVHHPTAVTDRSLVFIPTIYDFIAVVGLVYCKYIGAHIKVYTLHFKT